MTATTKPELDPSRCPDCGYYWPAHFTTDNGQAKVLGCVPGPRAQMFIEQLPVVTVRRGRYDATRKPNWNHGTREIVNRAGHLLICFRDCYDVDAGRVLVLDLVLGEYYEIDTRFLLNTTTRVKGPDLDRVIDEITDTLGYRVRVVGGLRK